MMNFRFFFWLYVYMCGSGDNNIKVIQSWISDGMSFFFFFQSAAVVMCLGDWNLSPMTHTTHGCYYPAAVCLCVCMEFE